MMVVPSGIGVVDLMIGFPIRDPRRHDADVCRLATDAAGVDDHVWPLFLCENALRVLGLGRG